MIGVASLFFDGTALPMVGTIALCSIAVLFLAVVTLRPDGLAAPSVEAAEERS